MSALDLNVKTYHLMLEVAALPQEERALHIDKKSPEEIRSSISEVFTKAIDELEQVKKAYKKHKMKTMIATLYFLGAIGGAATILVGLVLGSKIAMIPGGIGFLICVINAMVHSNSSFSRSFKPKFSMDNYNREIFAYSCCDPQKNIENRITVMRQVLLVIKKAGFVPFIADQKQKLEQALHGDSNYQRALCRLHKATLALQKMCEHNARYQVKYACDRFTYEEFNLAQEWVNWLEGTFGPKDLSATSIVAHFMKTYLANNPVELGAVPATS